MEIGLNSLAS